MRAAAMREGIDLGVFSAFRDFDAQARIWNLKYSGDRPLYDAHGTEIDYETLTEEDRIQCILNWSALPGASRHHWGTDLDVYDRAAMPAGYRLRMLPEEFGPGGVFDRLGTWLEANIARFDFFRPYARYNGGMFSEPWHLSYAPLSTPALEALTPDVVEEAVAQSAILGRDKVLARMPEIFERHVRNVCPAG